jgi:hypothetical protein
MTSSRLALLNTSILTAFGTYRYESLSLDQARALIRDHSANEKPIQSAIGHQPTAELLGALLGFPIPKNRIEFHQAIDDIGLVFKLKRRPPEGKVLDREEIEEIGYEFGLLTRIE